MKTNSKKNGKKVSVEGGKHKKLNKNSQLRNSRRHLFSKDFICNSPSGS